MMSKRFFILSLTIIGLTCILFTSYANATITFFNTGNGYNIRIRGQDYTNVTEAIYQKDLSDPTVNIANRTFDVLNSYYNCSWNIGQATRAVNVTIKNRVLYFCNDGNGLTVNPLIFTSQYKSNLTLINCTIYINDTSGAVDTLFSGSGWATFIDCYIKSMRSSNIKILVSTGKRIYMTRCILDGCYLSGGSVYLNSVTIQNNSLYGIYATVVDSKDVNILYNTYGIVFSTISYDVRDISFSLNTYSIGFFGFNQICYMYNCSFDKINSNNIFGINTGILHLNYFHNYTVVNHSGYVNTAWLRIWNRTGILLKNYTFNTNKTFNVDSLRFNKSIIPQYDTPFRINVTNWYNRNEHSNFSLNNSLQKVRQIIFLDEGEKKETEKTIIYANNITLINPNPANSTTFFKTNFICNKTSGLTTSMDIISNKFKPLNETILGIGKQYENRQTNYNINRYLDDRYLAQTFTVGGNSDNETFVLNKIRIKINASAIPFTLYVKLCDNGLIPIHDVMGIYELKKPNSTIMEILNLMTSNQIYKLLSKYRECQNCKHKFILPISALITESKRYNFFIYCPRCQSSDIALISKETYLEG